MTATLTDPAANGSPAAVAPRHGFKSRKRGGYQRGRMILQRSGAGWQLTLPAGEADAARPAPERPGLWKLHGSGPARRLAFPIPAISVADRAGLDDDVINANLIDDGVINETRDEAGPFEACLRWALTSLAGEVPAGWAAPSEASVAEAAGETGLTIRCGSILRQIKVVRAERRFALRVPLAGPVPATLPERRAAWLGALLRDSQDRWQLVRCAMTPDDRAIAEVDLTGMPAAAAPFLLPAALASLRWLTGAVVETAELLLDPEADTELFQCHGPA
ncbi:MAG: hypothetical protein HKN82_02130 [Akkermansiaceae bacterium]|nr:hypothetical protein [Akkermansiaceae bacterium]NNM29691.1 hypothetical protein [Akkermansiaceae bacterium]